MDHSTYTVDMVLPCPECGLPFEQGEDYCDACMSPLRAQRGPNPGRASLAERRRTSQLVRTVTIATVIVAYGIVGATYAIALGMVGMLKTHDFVLFPYVAAVLVGAALVGIPGVTLHHYPQEGWIRRGRPRWWKGTLAAMAFSGMTAISVEVFMRPELSARGAQVWMHPASDVATAVSAVSTSAYLGATVLIAWLAIAPAFGPQLITRVERRALRRRAASAAA
ncbi:zinc ribbon domain-containing protein [Schumannella sp. 10F1B-5-1]|uniref:zinc ribbon domain-containing protein n=1 Tax=Schumannella sp. 10F1B-5-1 TaxID=2590780 RepID=UPI00113294BD|nr:zinc ribbon domain-containing protein [Schumannella sp. 10F1B-5-1]TPW71074.1 hypothetical protein FJ658_13395 [Schumannella sp. 10F1B-5-1]